jgi:hypothetical protein
LITLRQSKKKNEKMTGPMTDISGASNLPDDGCKPGVTSADALNAAIIVGLSIVSYSYHTAMFELEKENPKTCIIVQLNNRI